MFFPWSAILPIEFDSSRISLRSVLNLIERSGQCGVGEMRATAPFKPFDKGKYRIDYDRFNQASQPTIENKSSRSRKRRS
jgi:hypothetical protein